MYDNVYLKLFKSDVPTVDFLSEVPCRLQNSIVHEPQGNFPIYATGQLGNLNFNITEKMIKINNIYSIQKRKIPN